MYRNRQGEAVRATSAVDIAIWDIIGKALDKPIYRLLGSFRSTVPAYASGRHYREDEGVKEPVEEICSYVEMSFKAVKMKVNALPPKSQLPINYILKNIKSCGAIFQRPLFLPLRL